MTTLHFGDGGLPDLVVAVVHVVVGHDVPGGRQVVVGRPGGQGAGGPASRQLVSRCSSPEPGGADTGRGQVWQLYANTHTHAYL